MGAKNKVVTKRSVKNLAMFVFPILAYLCFLLMSKTDVASVSILLGVAASPLVVTSGYAWISEIYDWFADLPE